jgi:tRNA(fMet)-specific endonuclease VapC
MDFLLDSDICINIMRGESEELLQQVVALGPDQVRLPSIVCVELMYGAYKSDHRVATTRATERFIDLFEQVPFNDRCIAQYAALRCGLEMRGERIGANDMLIAATALANGSVLVTHNWREFSRIPELPIETWALVDY